MTTATEQSAQSVESPPQRVRLSVEELIVGRSIEFPLIDQDGVLLLAEGSVITSAIKKVLKDRRSQDVFVCESDARRVTLQAIDLAATARALAFDTELTRKIDALIDSGNMSLVNKGPALKGQLAHRGKQRYDAKQRERVEAEHETNTRKLSATISEALQGNITDGASIASIAGTYLQEMTTDLDNVLTTKIPTFQNEELAARALETSLLAMAIGIEMGLDTENTRILGIAALVHDWGMALIPEHIRNPNRPLTPVERLELQKHPIYSLGMLQSISSLPSAVSVIAYQVHESPNGRGYPRGRTGNSIHLLARVLNVADAYVELTHPRPYRGPFMKYAAMEFLLRRARDRQVDPEVVRNLLLIQSLFPIGSLVSLSDGSVAQVLRRNHEKYTCPVVMLIQDATGNPADAESAESIIDLAESELSVQEALPTPGRKEIPWDPDLQ